MFGRLSMSSTRKTMCSLVTGRQHGDLRSGCPTFARPTRPPCGNGASSEVGRSPAPLDARALFGHAEFEGMKSPRKSADGMNALGQREVDWPLVEGALAVRPTVKSSPAGRVQALLFLARRLPK